MDLGQKKTSLSSMVGGTSKKDGGLLMNCHLATTKWWAHEKQRTDRSQGLALGPNQKKHLPYKWQSAFKKADAY